MVMHSDAPYLPQDIITNIFKRLPVKSLIRFQCVCEDWKNLINTPSFIQQHLSHSTQQNDFLLFKSNSLEGNPTWHLRLINRDMQVIQYQNVPSSAPTCCIVGSSNGLLCLRCLKFESFILWNPAIRKTLHVPKIRHSVACLVGFGFSPIVNDYKLVRLSLSLTDVGYQISIVQVFSLITRSWKEVEVETGKLEGILPIVVAPGFTFDGAIFWIALRFKRDAAHKYCLISFDITTESLTFVPIPTSVKVLPSSNRLTTLGNKLAMLSYSTIWVAEKCTDKLGRRWIWTEIYTVNPGPYPSRDLSPLTVWRNHFFGEFGGFVNRVERELILNNLHTSEFKILAIRERSVIGQIWSYAESLVSLGNYHFEASSS